MKTHDTLTSASLVLDQRVPLSHLQTPLEPMERMAAYLDMQPGHLWIKRDDLTGLGGGGNKTRKLEYLCAEAHAQGCDTLVTGGGRQSNHARLTAAAANRLGLACTLVLTSDDAGTHTGNVLLDDLLGPEITWVGRRNWYELEAEIEATCTRLSSQGHRPYAIPPGGGNARGALGYVRLAQELSTHLPAETLVVTASGSGGTQAGLVAGFEAFHRVLGMDVGARPDVAEHIVTTAFATAQLAHLPLPGGQCLLDRRQVGAGYGCLTEQSIEALHLAARLEGLFLDPVYTSKAFAGLIAARREGFIQANTSVVFLHTGGLPGLFA